MAQKVGSGIALLFHDRGTRRGEWSAARLGRTLPPGKTRYPFYSRLGVPLGRSGRAENLVPTGIQSRTVQPVAQSLYRLRYPVHAYIHGTCLLIEHIWVVKRKENVQPLKYAKCKCLYFQNVLKLLGVHS